MGVGFLWLLFICIGAVIVFSGYRLTIYGDIIGSRSKLGHSWVGTILLASVTSLPELVTMLTLATLGSADIAIADIFGSNVFNMFVVFILDILIIGAIFRKIQKSHLISGMIGIVLSTIVLLSFLTQAFIGRENLSGYSDNPIGYDSVLILIGYVVGMYLLFRKSSPATGESVPQPKYQKISNGVIYRRYSFWALIIVSSGILMGIIGNHLATKPLNLFGLEITLGGTIMGTIFFAITTSLPELAVSVSSIKIKSYNMAFGNVLGSNLFNLAIIGIGDVCFTKGPILFHCGYAQAITLAESMLMIGIVTFAIKVAPKKHLLKRLSIPSFFLALIYLIGLLLISKITLIIH